MGFLPFGAGVMILVFGVLDLLRNEIFLCFMGLYLRRKKEENNDFPGITLAISLFRKLSE